MEDINKTLKEYYDALDRLIKNKPINVAVNTKIGNDTVSLEAGRGRGSIKKGRDVFDKLIEAIDDAKLIKQKPKIIQEAKIDKLKKSTNKYKEMYFEALNREIMYLERINELEKKLNKKNPFSINSEDYKR
jgi:penicillin-binding protein-related factor A (putative recombinase)